MIRLFLLLLCLSSFAHATVSPPSFAERDDVRVFAREMHDRHDFDYDELLRRFARVRPLPAVIKAIQPPGEADVRSWQAYRTRFVEPRRIAAGIRFWNAHEASIARAQLIYGVPAEILVGIIGVETFYGKHQGRFQTFSALTTLAFDYPPRAALFRRELESLLLLSRDQKRDLFSYRGSFAGAIGLPQFLPSSIRQWAVDFDGSEGIDLSRSAADAIGSVASFLAQHGWERDGPVLVDATAVGPRTDELLADGIEPKLRPAELVDYGISADNAPDLPAALIDYVTPDAPTTYRLGFHNFYVLTRYNRSTFYASAVYDLALAVRALKEQKR